MVKQVSKDRATLKLLSYLAEALENNPTGFMQYFDFEIAGNQIKGRIEVEYNEAEVNHDALEE